MAAPDDYYGVQLSTFGGEWKMDWLNMPMETFDREHLKANAAEIKFLSGSTPLSEALDALAPTMKGRATHSAVLIFSDGMSDPEAALASARCVVELGPGTGGTTRALLRALSPEARLLAIELGEDFADRLRTGLADPRLIVQQGSAESIGRFLEAYRLPAPDAIVSGIPFSTMPPEVADRIAAEVARVLAPGGRFVAYQVRDAVASYTTPYLGQPLKEWEWVNIPPVRVFTWTRAG